jgi:hypothetical protein
LVHNGKIYPANQIGLTYRPDAELPWRDASGSLFNRDTKEFEGRESDFILWNDVGDYTRIVINELGELTGKKFGRIRYMRQDSKCGLSVHADFERRYHIVLETNPYAFFGDATVDGEVTAKCYHIPADGHFYHVDTTRQHFVYNGGWTSRIHLVICEV